VLQVKTMLSHHFDAGTRQWNSNSRSLGRLSWTEMEIGSRQSAQAVSMRPSTPSAAQTPKASQAQFANHERPSAWTLNAVGTAENGLAIRMADRASSSTSACCS